MNAVRPDYITTQALLGCEGRCDRPTNHRYVGRLAVYVGCDVINGWKLRYQCDYCCHNRTWGEEAA